MLVERDLCINVIVLRKILLPKPVKLQETQAAKKNQKRKKKKERGDQSGGG